MIQLLIATIDEPNDRTFMEQVYEQYHRLIYAEIGKYVHNSWDIEDIMQSVLIRLISKIPKLRDLDRNQRINYIIVASRNSAFNFLRDHKRAALFSYDEELDSLDDRSAPEDHLARVELAEDIGRAWAALDERSRYLLEMKYILDMENEDIAKEIGVTPSSVRMLLTRARKHLKEQLQAEA